MKWVQENLWKEAESSGMSVDVILSRLNGGAVQWRRRDYWWVEAKWTRGDHEDRTLEVVAKAWQKVNEFQKVINSIGDWRLYLRRRRVYQPQRLGTLVVSRRGWRLELRERVRITISLAVTVTVIRTCARDLMTDSRHIAVAARPSSQHARMI